jgi:hypothetical protein
MSATMDSNWLTPIRIGKVPPGVTEETRRAYLAELRKMTSMHVLVLPAGVIIE